MFAGTPNFLLFEPQRNYNFEVIFWKDPTALVTQGFSGEQLTTLKKILDIATLIYVSDKVKTIHPPDTQIQTKGIDMGPAGSIPIPEKITFAEFSVEFIDDELGVVRNFWRDYFKGMLVGANGGMQLGFDTIDRMVLTVIEYHIIKVAGECFSYTFRGPIGLRTTNSHQ